MANRYFTNWNKRIGVAVAFGPIAIGVKFYFWFERESMRRATRMCTSTLIFLWRNDIYFRQRRGKQTARETIICRLAAGNFEDETVSVQNIIYRMAAKKFEYETNSTQVRFVE